MSYPRLISRLPRAAEVTDALETGSDPGVLWAKWIEALSERTPS